MASESFKKYEEFKKQYPVGSEVRVKYDNEWGKVYGYRYTTLGVHEDKTNAVVEVRHYFGFVKDYLLDEIEPWSDQNIPAGFLGKLLCFMGFHNFEEQPSRKDVVKKGLNILLSYSGVQKGIKLCRRSECAAEKTVWRYGSHDLDRVGTSWMPLDSKEETEIDSLPVF